MLFKIKLYNSSSTLFWHEFTGNFCEDNYIKTNVLVVENSASFNQSELIIC